MIILAIVYYLFHMKRKFFKRLEKSKLLLCIGEMKIYV